MLWITVIFKITFWLTKDIIFDNLGNMKRINLLKKLESYPVFTNKTVRDITGKGPDYIKLLIHRLKKEGLVHEIEKNKYSTHEDSLLVASNLVWPSYLSCWTALRFHNLTEQIPTGIFVITTRSKKKRRLRFENTDITFIKINKKYFFGYKKETYAGFTIFMAEPEKALIDSALFKKISFSELFDILKRNKEKININILISYLLKTKKKSLIKRFGFALDELGMDYFNKFNKFIDNKYLSLDYAFIKTGDKDEKWKVIKNFKP